MSRLSSFVLVGSLLAVDVLFIRWLFDASGNPAAAIVAGSILAMLSLGSTWWLLRSVDTSTNGRLVFRVNPRTRELGDEVSGTVEVAGRSDVDVHALTVGLVAVARHCGDELWRSEQHPVGPMDADGRTQVFAFSFDLPSTIDAGPSPAPGETIRWSLVANLPLTDGVLNAEQVVSVAGEPSR